MYKSYRSEQESGISTNHPQDAESNSAMAKFDVVFVLGGPGVGKGTQCTRIVENFGFQHLSAGDLLREEKAKAESSELGQMISECMTAGKIVPVSITCRLLRQEMEKQLAEKGHRKFLVDGFPRNEENRKGWEDEMSTSSRVLFVLVFDAPDDICVHRCMSRGRGDDNEDTIRRRVQQFHTGCEEVISKFKQQNLVRMIAAEKSPDDVWNDVKKLFESEAK